MCDRRVMIDTFDRVTEDQISDFLKLEDYYPKATSYTNEEFLRLAKLGDKDARGYLVKSNLGLIISAAKKKKPLAEKMTFLDLIQEGVCGFLAAIDKYDENKGAKFTTYATECIENQIIQSLKISGNQDISRPTYIGIAVFNYNKLMAAQKIAGEPELSDEELKKLLHLTDNGLEAVKKDGDLRVESLNEFCNSDGTSEKIDFCSSDYELESTLLSEMSQRSLFIFLKHSFSPLHYYIIYNRFVREQNGSQIGEPFNLDRRNIHQMERIIYRKLREMCDENRILNYDLRKIGTQRQIEMMSMEPMNPNEIVKYMFFKNYLPSKERELYKAIIVHEYEFYTSIYASMLGVSEEELLEIHTSLNRKLANLEKYFADQLESFKNDIRVKIGKKIFDHDWDAEFKDEKEFASMM